MPLSNGTSLGRYEIRAQLGAGGMGEVYLAHDTQLGRKVALKVLPADLINSSERLRRFEQEARAASALNHQNILTIYEIGAEGDTHFIATEFIEGETLRQKMQTARLEIEETLNIAIQIATALDAAHRSGIVHRDIKPENVMVREDGLVKVLDFGLAKLTEKKDDAAIDMEAPTRAQVQTSPGVVMGTVVYMSPEQARGKDTDARTDIWSLGCVLYEMVTRRLPFAGETTSDTIAAILTREPPQLSQYVAGAPAELQRIIGKTLRKNREERYQHVKDLWIDLKDLKQELEFAAKLERSATPDTSGAEEIKRDADARTRILTEDKFTDAATVAVSPQAKTYFWKPQSRVLAIALIILAATAGIVYFALSNKTTKQETSVDAADKTLAVLPFKLLNPNDETNYLSVGLADSLITKLSNVRSLTVRPTSSVIRYANETDTAGAGRELKVETVIDGTVQQAGDRVRVSVQMIRAADGKSLWANTYDAQLVNIFQVQDEISAKITEALKIQLSSDERARISRPPTDNIEAYQLYLRGNYYLYSFTPDSLQKALQNYNQAVALDPTYALAYAGLANAYGISAPFGNDEAALRAEAAALKAIELDPTLGEARAALAVTQFWKKRETDKAQNSFNRALELNPNSAVIRHYYSWFLIATARFDEAGQHLRRALELDPLSPGINVDQGLPLFFARRYTEARASYEQALKLDANFAYAHQRLSEACEGAGDFVCAIAEFERAIALSNNDSMVKIQLARSLALAGKRDEARRLLKELTAQDTPRISPYHLALVYIALNEPDEAFANLNRALAEQDKWLGWIKVDPRLDSLRPDPRYQDLLRRVGLPQ